MEHTRKERRRRTLPLRLTRLSAFALALLLLLMAGRPHAKTGQLQPAHAETAYCAITPDAPYTATVYDYVEVEPVA